MKSIDILLVEDNEGDILMTKEALTEVNVKNNLTVAKNGEQAIQILRRENGYEHSHRPDIILLDINLPRINGHEVLAEIKKDKNLRPVPVIILTTSSSKKDINEAYMGYANCCVIKPIKGVDFVHTIANIIQFWISIVELPEIKN